jgi:hypothetical protein
LHKWDQWCSVDPIQAVVVRGDALFIVLPHEIQSDGRVRYYALAVLSPLWHPFVELPRPSARRLVFGAYCAVVYLWLAAPLVAELYRRRAPIAPLAAARREVTAWRL